MSFEYSDHPSSRLGQLGGALCGQGIQQNGMHQNASPRCDTPTQMELKGIHHAINLLKDRVAALEPKPKPTALVTRETLAEAWDEVQAGNPDIKVNFSHASKFFEALTAVLGV